MTLSELQQNAYSELPNYRIIGGGKKIAIYFTSNDLYWPDTPESFQYSIIEKDRYEWTNLLIKRCDKHIFIRDVYKEWYITGINKDINNTERLLEFLRKETKGCSELICVGSSAGGYAASLFGSLLNADIVFNFNGQWDINETIKKHGYTRLDDLRNLYGKFYNIVPLVKNTSNVFYFVSSKSKWDMEQFKHSERLDLQRIYFNTSHHGIPFLKAALPHVLNLGKDDLLQLTNKSFNPLIFTIKYAGLIETIKGLYKQYQSKRKRKKK